MSEKRCPIEPDCKETGEHTHQIKYLHDPDCPAGAHYKWNSKNNLGTFPVTPGSLPPTVQNAIDSVKKEDELDDFSVKEIITTLKSLGSLACYTCYREIKDFEKISWRIRFTGGPDLYVPVCVNCARLEKKKEKNLATVSSLSEVDIPK